MALLRRTFSVGAAGLALGLAGRAHALEGDETSIGAPGAPLHLVEYASTTCPHCARFHETNWARLKADYIDAGRVRLTLREMVTPPPAVALAMFQLARCGNANASEYFRRVGILFQRCPQILATGTIAGVRDALLALGAEWGLSQEQVMGSLTDPAGSERIIRSMEAANQRGVTGTPAFFLGDARIEDASFHTPDGMARILDARLVRR